VPSSEISYDTILYRAPPPRLWPLKGAGWTGGVAGFLEGQSRGLEPVSALRPSTEMISCLWPTWMVKVFAPLETTRYGPGRARAGIRGRQRLLLAANTHVDMLHLG
jgi:hypothetical protein